MSGPRGIMSVSKKRIMRILFECHMAQKGNYARARVHIEGVL